MQEDTTTMNKEKPKRYTVSVVTPLTDAQQIEFKTYLKQFSGDTLRKALTELHKYLLKRLIKFQLSDITGKPYADILINSILSDEKLVSGLHDYPNYYMDVIFNKKGKPKEDELKISDEEKRKKKELYETWAIESIIFIFIKYGGINIDKETNTLFVNDIKINLKTENQAAKKYLLRYWRQRNMYETDARMGTYYVELNVDEPFSQLINSRNEVFTGSVHIQHTLNGGRVISIFYVPKSERYGQAISVFFFLQDKPEYQENIWVTYAKDRRDASGVIAYGNGYLEKYDGNSTDWQNTSVSAELTYLLRRKRFELSESIERSTHKLASYPANIDRYQGIYRGHLIKLSNDTPSLESNLIILRKDGSVVIYTASSKSLPKNIYAGSYILVKPNENNFILINYDYNTVTQATNGFNRFSILLKEDDVSYQEEYAKYLIGIRTAFDHRNNNPITTKICLENLTDEAINRIELAVKEKKIESNSKKTDELYSILIDTFFEETGSISKNSTIAEIRSAIINSLYSIEINDSFLESEKTQNFFNQNSFLRKFFIGKAYNNFTDTDSILKLQALMPYNGPVGEFDCYSFSLSEGRAITEYDDKSSAIIKKYPIKIEKNGNAIIKIHEKHWIGQATFDHQTRDFSIVFCLNNQLYDYNYLSGSIFLSCLFSIPQSSHNNKHFGNHDRLAGTLQKKLREKPQVESRICVLRKSSKPFTRNPYESNIYFDSFIFRNRDKITGGILSYLVGPINNLARAEETITDFTPRLQKNSYKWDLFYSACYIAEKLGSEGFTHYSTKDVESKLFQAYVHGFAQAYYRGLNVSNNEYSGKSSDILKEEALALTRAMEEPGSPLNKPALKNYINKLWYGRGQKDGFLHFLSATESEVFKIVLPHPIDTKNITHSDIRTADIIRDLFDYNHISKPFKINDSIFENSMINDEHEKPYYIAVGLFSNKLTVAVNNVSNPIDSGRYFKLIQGDGPTKNIVKVMNTIDGNINVNEDTWPEYSIYGDIEDYAIIAKVTHNNKKALICGGLNTDGTEFIGDYLEAHWKELWQQEDEDSQTTIFDSDHFVCLFALFKSGNFSKIIVRAIKDI